MRKGPVHGWGLVALALLAVPIALVASSSPSTADGTASGISAAGVNLFDVIRWDQVQALTPCGQGANTLTPNAAMYDEGADSPSETLAPLRGCSEFRFHYKAPYPTDHIHVRFDYELNYTVAGMESTWEGAQTVAVEGPGGVVAPVSFREDDTEYDEHWGHAGSAWVQDPGDELPLHFNGAPQQEGDIVWRFQDVGNLTSLPVGSVPRGLGRLEARLGSSFQEPGFVFRDHSDESFQPSHVEYSFVSYPHTRVEQREMVRDGRIHKETHFIVNVTEETLQRYWVSTQLIMDQGMQFSRIILPDGSNITRTASFESTDWRNLRFEVAELQSLVNLVGSTQITVPVTLINLEGPGEYDIVVERPGASVPVADAKISTLFLIVMAAPAIAAYLAFRNLRRLLATIPAGMEEDTGTSRVVLVTWFVALLVAHIGIVLFVFLVGFTRVAAPNPDPLGFLVLIILLFIAAGQGLLAARGSDRVIRSMREKIERQQRIEEALLRSNKDLELFASTAVHDLGAPLRGVAGFAKVLERDHAQALDADGRKLLKHVVQGAERMQDLVRSLLDFARAQSGSQNLEVVDLGVVARQVVATLQHQVRASHAEVSFGKLPRVMASRAGITRVMQNLVENAIKFRAPERPPRIRIEATRSGDHWEIAVKDNGIGIAAEEIGDMGRPFRRGLQTQRYEGSGLGLASAQRILGAAGGRLWLTSKIGEGTTVHFRLSATDNPGKPGPLPSSQPG